MSILLHILGIVIGAALMYYFDPQLGRRRRSLLGDKMASAQNSATAGAEAMAKDVSNRSRGAAVEMARRVAPKDVSDHTLAERVRSEMGRYVSHPGAVEVAVDSGVVTLSGSILANEVQPFVKQVKAMPRVEKVENALEVHQSADGVPELQGGQIPPEHR
ncbi:MAG: BON domain-containing protein [Chloroflexota bacterium]